MGDQTQHTSKLKKNILLVTLNALKLAAFSLFILQRKLPDQTQKSFLQVTVWELSISESWS